MSKCQVQEVDIECISNMFTDKEQYPLADHSIIKFLQALISSLEKFTVWFDT